MNLVTFIIPTTGRPSLQASLNSLLHQTIGNWKAIVVVDGVESPNITCNDSRIKLITTGYTTQIGDHDKLNDHLTTNRSGELRNIGIQLCDTDWVVFLDDNNTLSYTYLETFYNELNLIYDVDVVIFKMNHPDYGILPKLNSISFYENEAGACFAMKRKIFDQDIRFVPSHDEIYTLLHSVREKGYRIVLSPYVKYFANNMGHSEIFPEKGRRILINAVK
jgi:glycosyltransferase involved in cell wall biosynthesis